MLARGWLLLGAAALCVSHCRNQEPAISSQKAGGPAASLPERAALALVQSTDAVYSIELLTPAGAYGTPTPLLTWTPIDGADSYEVNVTDSDCLTPLQSLVSPTTKQATQFLANGHYTACIAAKGRTGATLATGQGSFWVLTHDVVDARLQNSVGAAGAPIQTENLATFPLFQEDWSSKQANRYGGPVRRDGVADVAGFGIYSDPASGSKLRLVVSDRGNHRVLLFDSVPVRGDEEPQVVVGQVDFDSGRRNGDGGDVNNSVFGDNVHASVCPEGQLLVTDRGNNRVLIWRHLPDTNGAPADIVLGQEDFVGSAPGAGAAGLSQPSAAYCLGGKLLIADRGNNRILVYKKLPQKNGAAADYAIGQPSLDAQAAGCAADRLNGPGQLLLDDGKLYVVDTDNNRVVVYPSLPSGFGARATAVLGQARLDTCLVNRGAGVTASTLNAPSAVAARGPSLAVSDEGNNRVLLYTLPAVAGQAAASVIGQPNARTTRRSDEPELGTFLEPKDLVFDGNFLWINDSANKRLITMPLPL